MKRIDGLRHDLSREKKFSICHFPFSIFNGFADAGETADYLARVSSGQACLLRLRSMAIGKFKMENGKFFCWV
jgi:hypothetical protein